MKLTSNDLHYGEKINLNFTCDGENISPHLKWEEVPPDTKSFAISCIDIDSKAGTWIHWYVVNIPNNIREIVQGGPVPGKELENDFGNTEYGGPCPEKGEHRYFFTIYALKTKTIDKIDKDNFAQEVTNYLLDSDKIMVKYEKRK